MFVKKYAKVTLAFLLVIYTSSCAGTDAPTKVVNTKANGEVGNVSQESTGEAARAKIVKFAKSQKGKQVGDGECYALAAEAYQAAGISIPRSRVWGRIVDWKKEPVLPGDIIEFKSAVFPYVTTGENHTAIVRSKGKNGNCDTYEQNVNGRKKVSRGPYYLSKLKSGSAIVYRYE